jgi:DNA (cytosine-5)-methyltransferase 1
MEHREIKTPEQIAELKELSPGGYRNLREVVINELPDSSLFMTPTAVEGEGGSVGERKKLELGHYVMLRDQVKDLAEDNGLLDDALLPTPAVGHIRNYDEPIEDYLERRQKFTDGEYRGMPGISLGVAVRMEMLPTPVASEGLKAPAQQDAETKSKTGQVWLSNVAKGISNDNIDLFPTLRASDGYERRNQKTMDKIAAEGGDLTMPTLARTTVSWGKFTPAIERWEAVTRPAPAPTKPDGKDGNHRLSAEFTEWMMGLPAGWVTDPEMGLKRNDQLKACGNGVVPQQAELALRILLEDVNLEGM